MERPEQSGQQGASSCLSPPQTPELSTLKVPVGLARGQTQSCLRDFLEGKRDPHPAVPVNKGKTMQTLGPLNRMEESTAGGTHTGADHTAAQVSYTEGTGWGCGAHSRAPALQGSSGYFKYFRKSTDILHLAIVRLLGFTKIPRLCFGLELHQCNAETLASLS